MTLFVVSVVVVLAVSAICSLTEAAFYAVRMPYVRQLSEQGSRAGRILEAFKENMERPISAILIVNTVANTAGAAVAGAQASQLFKDETAVLWFSIAFTAGVLFLSEIIPKVLGVTYSGPVARTLVLPWAGIMVLLFPLIWLVQQMSRLLKPSEPMLSAPEDEVQQLAMISAEEGSISAREAELVENVLKLDRISADEIMTPRPVVLRLPGDMTLKDVADQVKDWTFSRIPVYDPADPDTWQGFVFTRDVLTGLANDQFDKTLGELTRELYFVSETTRGHILLRTFLKRRTHLFGVVNDYGDITGIVTLEDVLESVIGEEIVDEADSAVDMQEVARRRRRDHFRETEASGTVKQVGADDDLDRDDEQGDERTDATKS